MASTKRDHRLWRTRKVNCDVARILPVKDIVPSKMKATMRSPVFVFEIQRAVLLDDALAFSHFRTGRKQVPEVGATQHTWYVFLEFVARCYSRFSKDFAGRIANLESIACDDDATDEQRNSIPDKLKEFRDARNAGRILFFFVETVLDRSGDIFAYRFWFLNRYVMVDTNAVWTEMLYDSNADAYGQINSGGSSSGRSDQWKANLADRVAFSESVDVLNFVGHDQDSRVLLDVLSNPCSPAHPNQCFSPPQLVLRTQSAQSSQQVSRYFCDQSTSFDPPQARFLYQVDASEVLTRLENKLLPHVQAEMALTDTVLWMFMFKKIDEAGECDGGDNDRTDMNIDDEDDEDEEDEELQEVAVRDFFCQFGEDPGPLRKKQKKPGEVRLHFVNGGDYVAESLKAVNPYKPLQDQGRVLLANVREFDNALLRETEEPDQMLPRWMYVLLRRRMWRMYCVYARHADNSVMSRPMAAIHNARTQEDLYASANVFTLQHWDPEMPLFCNWEGKRLIELYLAFQSCVPSLLDLLLKYRLDAFCVDDKRVHQHSLQQSHRGGTGKSFLLKVCGVWCSIPETAFTLAYNSDKCFADDSRNQHDMVFYTHECKDDTLFNANSQAHALLKCLLSENMQSHIVLQMEPPPRETKMSHVPMICCWFGCRNAVLGKPQVMSHALSSRFDMRFSKERPGDTQHLISLFLKDVRTGSTQQQQVKDQTAKNYRTLQGIVAELEKCIASEALCDVSTHLAGVFFKFVADKLRTGTQNVRLFERAITHSRINAFLDGIAKTWMYEGAPLYGQDIDLEAGLPYLERFFYVGVEHCIAAFGDLLPLFFDNATMAFAQAIPVLTQPDRYQDVKVDVCGLSFPKKNYYVFFYTKKEMRETLLDIIINHTGKDSGNLITAEHFETLMDANLRLEAPLFTGTSTQAGTVNIPLFYTYIVPGNGDLHKRTHNQNGEIHGIAVHFATLWARDPELVADEIVQAFLGHKYQIPRKYTFRPHGTTVYTKTTIVANQVNGDRPVFKVPQENTTQHAIIGMLPESARLLTKAMINNFCPNGEIRMDFDTWALLLHNKLLQIDCECPIPQDAVRTSVFTEGAFSDLRDWITDNNDNDDDDDESSVPFFAGKELSHYLDTVKPLRPSWQYNFLYDSVTNEVKLAAKTTSFTDCYDFPTQLLFDETSQRYAWQEKEFAQWQCAIDAADQIKAPSANNPQFYIVDESASAKLKQAACECNAACMKLVFPHTLIYPTILQVRRRHTFDNKLPEKSYPSEWITTAPERESAVSDSETAGAPPGLDELPQFSF